MSESSVREQLHNLERRVTVLEKRSFSGWFKRAWQSLSVRSEEDTARLAGWFIITLSLLGLIRDWVVLQQINVLFGLSFILGLGLLVRSSSLLTMSESTKALYDEERAHRVIAAHDIHHRHHTPANEVLGLVNFVRMTLILLGIAMLGVVVTYLSLQYITDVIWQGVPVIILLGCLTMVGIEKRIAWLTYAGMACIYLVLAASVSPLFALTCTFFATVIFAAVAWKRQDWWLLALTSLLGYASLLRWIWHFSQNGTYQLQSLANWMPEHQIALLANVIFVVLFVAPFIYRRRAIADRYLARTTMAITAIGFALTTTWLADYLGQYRWFVSLASLLVVLASFGLLSWMRHGHFSYAKYFLVLAIATCVGVAYAYFDTIGITLLWFILAVLLLTTGFLVPSYTARWLGLLVLAISCLHYVLLILPFPSQYAGNVFLHERVWVGLILSIYLPVLALWFEESKVQGVERQLIPVLTTTFFATSFLFLFAIVSYEATGWVESILWIGVGMAGLLAGMWQRLGLLRTLGLGLIAGSLVKLLMVDSLHFSTNWQLALFAIFAVILISVGVSARRYQHLVRVYLRF